MSALVQNVLVAAIVLAAAGFLVWKRVRRKARPSPLCGDCPACGPPQDRDDWSKLENPRPRLVRRNGPR